MKVQYNLNDLSAYLAKAYEPIPQYIKDKQIQNYRYFTCCDDIAKVIQKRKMEGKKSTINSLLNRKEN